MKPATLVQWQLHPTLNGYGEALFKATLRAHGSLIDEVVLLVLDPTERPWPRIIRGRLLGGATGSVMLNVGSLPWIARDIAVTVTAERFAAGPQVQSWPTV